MDRYDYYREVKNDAIDEIIECVKWNADYLENSNDEIYDDLWIDDSVTGNASGSYTVNTWTAEEYICHNMDLLGEALADFGYDADYITEHGAEACDVAIRCWVLGQVIDEAIDEAREIIEEANNEK